MARKWVPTPMPLLAGEDTGSAPLATDRPARVENGVLTGRGAIEQAPDWRLAATCTDGANENNAVCGGPFPFATQGGLAAPSAGVAFSFDGTSDAIWLHQLGEDHAILRTIQAYASYVEANPPQMTAFEYFGRLIFCADGREAAANRRGLGIYDPAGGGSVVVPSLEIVTGGAAAGTLRFRGIAKHKGGTVLGWGYRSEEVGAVDRPDILRGAGYGATDLSLQAAWQPDGSDISPWELLIGTPGLPIVACGSSGDYTILGKESEVFALGGDFFQQLFYNPVGFAHGPVSTTGLASNGDIACWMAQAGPAVSVRGGQVQLLGTDRLRRRLLTYFDLTYTCAAYDAARTRFVFLLRRRSTLAGAPLSLAWGDQLLWWDHERDEFGVHGLPTTCFTVGTTNGPGRDLAAPAGTPASLSTSGLTFSAVTLTWTHAGGDPTAQISIEYRRLGDPAYTVVGPAAAGALSWLLSTLLAATEYQWQLRYYKNGQFGAYVSGPNFTTPAASSVGTPTNFAAAFLESFVYGGKTYVTFRLSWTRGEFSGGSQTQLFKSSVAVFDEGNALPAFDSGTVAFDDTEFLSTPVPVRYYWIRHKLPTGELGTVVGPLTITFDPGGP